MASSKLLRTDTLFELSDPMAVEPFRLRSRLPANARAGGIDVELLSQGKSKLEKPIQFDVAQGLKATDFLWTQLVTPVCVLERVIDILRKKEVTGWSTYPVEVFDQKGNLCADYHGLAVTGGICEADYSRSVVVTKPPPTSRGKSIDVYKGLYFDESKWDGSDMFWVGGVRVVVDKVKRIFEQNKVENVRITPLAEREIRVRYVRNS